MNKNKQSRINIDKTLQRNLITWRLWYFDLICKLHRMKFLNLILINLIQICITLCCINYLNSNKIDHRHWNPETNYSQIWSTMELPGKSLQDITNLWEMTRDPVTSSRWYTVPWPLKNKWYNTIWCTISSRRYTVPWPLKNKRYNTIWCTISSRWYIVPWPLKNKRYNTIWCTISSRRYTVPWPLKNKRYNTIWCIISSRWYTVPWPLKNKRYNTIWCTISSRWYTVPWPLKNKRYNTIWCIISSRWYTVPWPLKINDTIQYGVLFHPGDTLYHWSLNVNTFRFHQHHSHNYIHQVAEPLTSDHQTPSRRIYD